MFVPGEPLRRRSPAHWKATRNPSDVIVGSLQSAGARPPVSSSYPHTPLLNCARMIRRAGSSCVQRVDAGAARLPVDSKTIVLPSDVFAGLVLSPTGHWVTCATERGSPLSKTKISLPLLPLPSKSEVESNEIQRAASPCEKGRDSKMPRACGGTLGSSLLVWKGISMRNGVVR